MSTPRLPLWKRLRRTLKRLFSSRSREAQELHDEILALSSRTQSFEELLTLVPGRIRAALDLASFHTLLREGSSYVLQQPAGEPLAFPASCSTVSRMRRDRKPACFVAVPTPQSQPDAWQLLAEPFEIAALTELHAQVLLPLEGRTGLMGFATIDRENARPFTAAELRFLRDLGPELGRGLETAQLIRNLAAQAVERARANRELELAREVQDRLLPAKLPLLSGLDAAAAYRSAEQVGGDYYDLFPTPDGRICICIADVSGKGVPAALLMATLRASLHALMLGPVQLLPQVLERLNRLLYQASSSSRYATVFVCLYDPATCELTYVNAGHNPPMLLRQGGTVTRLTRGGMVVGLMPHASYDFETLSLAEEDTLVAYTDGVTEAVNPQGAEWEDSGLLAAVRLGAGQPRQVSADVVRSILTALDVFVGTAAQADDITLLVLRKR